jgi:hypothetical protein
MRWIFHGHGLFSPSLLVIVDQFNAKGIVPFKAENNSPIRPHPHGPEAPQIAFERMQPVAGQVERLRRRSLIEAGQNVLDHFPQIRPYAAGVITFMEPF